MIKFPYAISDFHLLRTKPYLYLDRTDCITTLEESGRQLVFLRPRRFGKSLLLSATDAEAGRAKAIEEWQTALSK